MRVCRMMVLAVTQAPPSGNLLEPAGLSLACSSTLVRRFTLKDTESWFLPLSLPLSACKHTDFLSIRSGDGRPGLFRRPPATHMEEEQFAFHSRSWKASRAEGRGSGSTAWAYGLWVPGVHKQRAQYPPTFGESEAFKWIRHEELRTWGLGCKAAFQECAGRAQGRAAMTCIQDGHTRPWV